MEGPSLVILAAELAPFTGRLILAVEGNTKIGKEQLINQKIVRIITWGKHLIIQCETVAIRIHFLMFGSYRINTTRDNMMPRLSLIFDEEEINFYSCSIKFIDVNIDSIYDWKIDIMSTAWDKKKVLALVRAQPDEYACDILLSQDVFAGVGNIIKNEVLFNIRVHPLSRVKAIPLKLLKQMVNEARAYSFNFYEWKKIFELRKHWLIYRKSECPRCELPVEIKKIGKRMRRSFYCSSCQVLFDDIKRSTVFKSKIKVKGFNL